MKISKEELLDFAFIMFIYLKLMEKLILVISELAELIDKL